MWERGWVGQGVMLAAVGMAQAFWKGPYALLAHAGMRLPQCYNPPHALPFHRQCHCQPSPAAWRLGAPPPKYIAHRTPFRREAISLRCPLCDALQGLMFSVLWRLGQDYYHAHMAHDRKAAT